MPENVSVVTYTKSKIDELINNKMQQLLTSGPPETGTWLKGSTVIDSAGRLWICNEAGTPGKWCTVGGTVLASAITTAAIPNLTAITDVAGATITFIAPNQPVIIDASIFGVVNDNAAGGWALQLTDSANALQQIYRNPVVDVVNSGEAGFIKELYTSLVPGNSYTYKLRLARILTGNVSAVSAIAPVFVSQLMAVAA